MSYQSKFTGLQIDEGIEKASKALTTPETAPSAVTIPAIDTNNAQTNLTLGDGLSVEDGVLNVNPLYVHYVGIASSPTADPSFSIQIMLLTRSSAAIRSKEMLLSAISEMGLSSLMLMATGAYHEGDVVTPIAKCIFRLTGDTFTITHGASSVAVDYSAIHKCVDSVVQL